MIEEVWDKRREGKTEDKSERRRVWEEDSAGMGLNKGRKIQFYKIQYDNIIIYK